MADVEAPEVRPKSKPKTWSGIQLFQLQDNAEWQKLINSGSLERIAKGGHNFIKVVERVEQKTGEKLMGTEVVQARINDLLQAAKGAAPKDGAPAVEMLQQFEAFLVTSRSLQAFDETPVDLNEPSGVTDIREMRKVADAEDRRARHAEEGGEHLQDKSEEFSFGDLGYAILGEDVPRVLFEDVQKEKDAEEEATNLRRRATDKLKETEILDDHLVQFLRVYRRVLDRHEGASPKPEDHRAGWGVTNTKRSLRAVIGLVPEVQPLVIEPFEPILIIPDQTEASF